MVVLILVTREGVGVTEAPGEVKYRSSVDNYEKCGSQSVARSGVIWPYM